MAYSLAKKKTDYTTQLNYSEFLQEVERTNVRTVRIEGNTVYGEYKAKGGEFNKFRTTVPNDDTLIPLLRKNSVDIEVTDPGDESSYMLFLLNALPILLFVGIWFLFWRQVQMGAGKGMNFGKSRAKLLTESQQKVTFADVAGIDEARG